MQADVIEKRDFSDWYFKRIELLEETCQALLLEIQPTKKFEKYVAVFNEKVAGFPEGAGRAISAKTLARLWYKWRKANKDWRAFIDRRTWYANRAMARTAQIRFRDYLYKLALRHPQSKKQAIEELYQAWREGATIPGYEGLNKEQGSPLPDGWSYDNLITKIPPLTVVEQEQKKVNQPCDIEARLEALVRLIEEFMEYKAEKARTGRK